MDEPIERTWISDTLEANLLFIEAAVNEWFLFSEVEGSSAIFVYDGIQVSQALGRINQNLGGRYAAQNHQFFIC